MFIPAMSDKNKWKLLVYTDAAHANLNGVGSVGAHLVFLSKGLSPLRRISAIDSHDRQRNLETTSPFLRLIVSELSMNGVSRGEFFGAIFAIK